ncbi:arginine/serine-rich protein 1 isoform X1 [Hylobates moloch]|uniref:arginine/serine-rich protein 1 isoform X1 n=1 Tax=Hylobates moloch TaxID=81572 RepID=UPI0013F2ADB7|nr:arginine/serine-rich protein 1 isoform X1 [Hylobates moloch]
MSNYVNDMWPGSPQEKDSPSTSRSGGSSRLSSRSRSRSFSRSSRSHSRVSSRFSSKSRSRRSRSRSRSRRRHQRKYRRYSRSYSRSRSRSRSRRYRERRHGFSRRYYRSPSRYRSRSRSRSRSHSRGRSYCGRAYAIARGQRYYGFGRTVYPEEHSRWRDRSRTRSRSRTPFRLSEKDRMELLEIAKANAAKALGTTNIDLPPSLRTVPVAKETSRGIGVSSNGAKPELLEKVTEDGTRNPNEEPTQQRSIAFSSNNSVAKPIQKSAKSATEETCSRSPKIDQKKSPYGLWIPI